MPDIDFDCPHCGQHLEAPEAMTGTDVDCPACNENIVVPKLPSGDSIEPTVDDACELTNPLSEESEPQTESTQEDSTGAAAPVESKADQEDPHSRITHVLDTAKKTRAKAKEVADRGIKNAKPHLKQAFDTAKKAGARSLAVADKGGKAAKQKFEDSGGVEGLKAKGKQFVVAVRAGFVPDEGVVGVKGGISRVRNLWRSGVPGKLVIVIAVCLFALAFHGGIANQPLVAALKTKPRKLSGTVVLKHRNGSTSPQSYITVYAVPSFPGSDLDTETCFWILKAKSDVTMAIFSTEYGYYKPTETTGDRSTVFCFLSDSVKASMPISDAVWGFMEQLADDASSNTAEYKALNSRMNRLAAEGLSLTGLIEKRQALIQKGKDIEELSNRVTLMAMCFFGFTACPDGSIKPSDALKTVNQEPAGKTYMQILDVLLSAYTELTHEAATEVLRSEPGHMEVVREGTLWRPRIEAIKLAEARTDVNGRFELAVRESVPVSIVAFDCSEAKTSIWCRDLSKGENDVILTQEDYVFSSSSTQ